MENLLSRFPARRAFITGAGSGLGRAIAVQLAQRGWMLGIQDINSTRATETLQVVQSSGGRGQVFIFDVSDPAAFQAAADSFVGAHGGVDLVFNNAGVGVGGLMEEVPLSDWQWIVGINLLGPIHGCRAFLPTLKKQSAGHLINVASVAGLVAAPGMSPYNATKFGVVGLSETLRAELQGEGVGVTVVCPSFFQTNIVRDARLGDPNMAGVAQKLMDRGFMKADDIALAVLKAVDANRFYVVPQPDARLMWWAKRLMPAVFIKLLATGYERGVKRAKRR